MLVICQSLYALKIFDLANLLPNMIGVQKTSVVFLVEHTFFEMVFKKNPLDWDRLL